MKGYALPFGAWLLLIAACGSSLEPPDGMATVTGEIVAVNHSMAVGLPSIHVKTTPTESCGIVFNTSDATITRRFVDGRIVMATSSELTVGTRVSVWSGAVAESCPGQARATYVQILAS